MTPPGPPGPQLAGLPLQQPAAGADGLPPLFDTGNGLLGTGVPCNMMTGLLPVPGGQVGVVTIRTTTCTLTITLSRKEAADFADMLADLRDNMSESGLVTAARPAKLGRL